MRDYEELVKALREADSLSMCGECGYKGDKKGPLFAKAADAIEELHRENESYANTINEASEILRNRLKSKWISVEDRLPKYGDWVLGIGPKKGYYICEYRGVTHFPYEGDIPWFAAKGRHVTVTHWMPLPKPPAKEEKTKNE